MAAPVGGQIGAGSGTIVQSGLTTTINQASQNLAINWQSFGIAANEAVRFNQPSASSIALNRITGQNPSQIFGSLSANGQVFILNPNGVLFGQGSQVNVGGLVASTLSLSDADFMVGKYSFSGNSGSVVNQGTLTAAQHGYIAMLAPEVRNEGVISAALGTALLAAGDKVTLNLNNGSLLSYSIDQGSINALADNKQLIQADGGQIFMSAKAADTLTTAVVNNTGVIQARTIQNINGTIMLMGDMQSGTVNVGGTLDASASNGGNGGFVETSAAHVKIADTAKITTAAANGLNGTWLIDPADFTIAATGGDMTGAALTTQLAGGNVIIQSTTGATGTAGNVNVNDAVSWSANQLTLNAQNNININAVMDATAAASLALEFGQGAVAAGNTSNIVTGVNGKVNLPASTSNFTTLQGSDGVLKNYIVITALGAEGSVTAADLQGINGNLAGNYVLGADIDATGASAWNAGDGFAPVANLQGTFDGLGHTIAGLTINRPLSYGVGLFGATTAASVIRNVGLTNVSVSGLNRVGGLVGSNYGTISNSYSTGSVSGSTYVGGLVGWNDGTISKISNSYATGSVSGIEFVGGLVGYANGGAISNSYASGSVSGSSYAGGLAGVVSTYATITNSFYDLDVVIINTLKPVAANGLYTSQFTDWKNSGFALNPVTYFGAATAANTYTVTGVQGLKDLLGFTGDAALTFNLAGNIDMAAAPAGFYLPTWAGTFDGANHTFSNFTLNLPTTSKVGLFGIALAGSSIKNIGMIGGSVTGSSYVGGLVGYGRGGTISNSYTTGSVSGSNYVGGLVGAGGGTISNSYATGSVSGSNYVGGLVGSAWSTTISNSYATGSVTGSSYVGGLVGSNWGTINNSYATGTVSGSDHVGGLLGYAGASFGDTNSISNSYATGTVSGSSQVGGLVGYAGASYGGTNSISNSYATGTVSGSSQVGGLLGKNVGSTLTANFWDVTQSGMADGLGIGLDGTTAGVAGTPQADVTGLTTAQMQTQSSFTPTGTAAGQWDFANTWVMYEGYTAPLLRSFMTALTVTANDASKTYDGLAYNGSGGVTYSVTPNMTNLLGTLSYTGGTNAGSHAIAPSGLYSNQQGYLISYVDGALTINKATATVTANSGSGTYSGIAQSVSGFTASGLVNGEAAGVLTGVTATGAIGTNAGTYTTTASGTDGNYTLTFVNGALTISKANATVTANSGSGTYSGIAQSVSGFTASGLVNGETASVLAGVSATGATGINAGSYTSTASGTDGNYNLSFVDGNLVINKADATVTANSGSTTYSGVAQSVNGFIASGLVNGETEAVLASVTAGGNGTNAGSYASTASGTDGNYNLSFVDGNLVINKADATVTANSGSTTYSGVAQSVNGFTASGLVNGETASVLASVTATGATGTNAGSYASTASGTDGNYNLSFVDGNLVINKADATVTANSVSTTYSGVAQSVNGFTASGLVNGETASVLASVTAGGSGTNAGSYASTASGTDGNYNLTFTDGALTIDKADATVTANSGSGIYSGVAQSVSGFTANGLVNGETASVLAGVAATGATGTNVGSYANTASGTDGNYNLTFTDGALTIDKADATVTANSGSGIYSGVAQSVSGFTASGLVNGETASVLSGVAATGATGTNVGSYTNTASGTDGNYNLTFADGALTIDKAHLTVTANDASRAFGAANPTLTTTVSGFVNNETASVLSGAGSATTTAGASTAVGSATITAGAGTLAASNYDFPTLVDGVLTITPTTSGVPVAVAQVLSAMPGGEKLLTIYATVRNTPPAMTVARTFDLPQREANKGDSDKPQQQRAQSANVVRDAAPTQQFGTFTVNRGGVSLPKGRMTSLPHKTVSQGINTPNRANVKEL